MKKPRIVLDKHWKEIVFAASGFGPNLLMVLMIAYFTDAVIPTGLSADISFWSYGGVVIVSTILFPILWTISRVFDGVIDVPLAALTDSFGKNNKKRGITLLISFLPMIVSYTLCWIPIFGKNPGISQTAQICNSIWIFLMSIIFFASYTIGLIVFYGSLSEVCSNQTQRSRVSSYKSIFDTINYALVYAAIPLIFKSINIPIWKVAIILSPLMITILIPLILFRKSSNVQTENEKKEDKEEKVPFGKSIALTVSSRPFMKWLIVNCIAFFGLQMFLVSQNTLISGVMNLGAKWAALLNTMAFAPVPIALYFFNKLRRKKGIRFCFQSCLISFAIGILSFSLGGTYFWGDNIVPKLIIGSIGGIIGSWGIGGFFMTPYLIPSQIAAVEKELTNKSHSAMYYAIQALATGAVGAFASSLIYNYLKLWVKPSPSPSIEWKCGVSMVPFIVIIFCIVGFFLCYLMPKKYTPQVVSLDIKNRTISRIKKLKKALNSTNKKLDEYIIKINATRLTKFEKELLINKYRENIQLRIISIKLKIEKSEKLLESINQYKKIDDEETYTNFEHEGKLERVLLFILSGTLFGIFDLFNTLKKCKIINIKFTKIQLALIYASLIIPFISIYSNYLIESKIENKLKEYNIKFKSRKVLVLITSIPLPLFTNIFAIIFRLNKLNTLVNVRVKM